MPSFVRGPRRFMLHQRRRIRIARINYALNLTHQKGHFMPTAWIYLLAPLFISSPWDLRSSQPYFRIIGLSGSNETCKYYFVIIALPTKVIKSISIDRIASP